MLVNCIAAGISINEFWTNTPRINHLAIKAFLQKQKAEYSKLAWVAWHTAAFQRAKKMPNLSKIITSINPAPRKKQSWQEQLKFVEMLNKHFGGNDLRKK